MPSLGTKFVRFFRTLSQSSDNTAEERLPGQVTPRTKKRDPARKTTTSPLAPVVWKYIAGGLRREHAELFYGKTCKSLPQKTVQKLSPEVVAACTGPGRGITSVSLDCIWPEMPGKNVTVYPSESQTSKREQVFTPTENWFKELQNLTLTNGYSDEHYDEYRSAEEKVDLHSLRRDLIEQNSDVTLKIITDKYRETQRPYTRHPTTLELPPDISSSILGTPSPTEPLEGLHGRFASAGSQDENSFTDNNDSCIKSIADLQKQLEFIDVSDNEELLGVYGKGEVPKPPPDSQVKKRKQKRGDRPTDLSIGLAHNGAKGSAEKPAPRSPKGPVAGVSSWKQPHRNVYGISTSLYEENPLTGERAGEPIADVFAVCARKDSALLSLADGVNWGEGAALAARCAARGCFEYLHTKFFACDTWPVENTQDIFKYLIRSFENSHNMILQAGGSLTTLCTALVCPLDGSSKRFLVCVSNVGDTYAYLYNPTAGVKEVTEGSHDVTIMRNVRDAGGALGPVCGERPELHNFTHSMCIAEPGDILFITSDGISDNFDPVIAKLATARNGFEIDPDVDTKPNGTIPNGGVVKIAHRPIKNIPKPKPDISPSKAVFKKSEPVTVRPPVRHSLPKTSSKPFQSGSKHRGSKAKIRRSMSLQEKLSRTLSGERPAEFGIPEIRALERHELTLLLMERVIRNKSSNGILTAQQLCEVLVDHAVQITQDRRDILEEVSLYQQDGSKLSFKEQKIRRQKAGARLLEKPGKLDHATVVAYKIGMSEEDLNPLPEPENVQMRKKKGNVLKRLFRPHSVACDHPVQYEPKTATYEIIDNPLSPSSYPQPEPNWKMEGVDETPEYEESSGENVNDSSSSDIPCNANEQPKSEIENAVNKLQKHLIISSNNTEDDRVKFCIGDHSGTPSENDPESEEIEIKPTYLCAITEVSSTAQSVCSDSVESLPLDSSAILSNREQCDILVDKSIHTLKGDSSVVNDAIPHSPELPDTECAIQKVVPNNLIKTNASVFEPVLPEREGLRTQSTVLGDIVVVITDYNDSEPDDQTISDNQTPPLNCCDNDDSSQNLVNNNSSDQKTKNQSENLDSCSGVDICNNVDVVELSEDMLNTADIAEEAQLPGDTYDVVNESISNDSALTDQVADAAVSSDNNNNSNVLPEADYS